MYRILCWILIGVLRMFSWLPLGVHYFFSDILYFILYKVFRYRLSVVTTNISRSFPEIDYKEVRRLAKEFYHSLSDTIVEAIWAFTSSREKVAKLLDFTGCDVLNEAYGEGRNVIVLLGHQSNWELYTSLPDLQKHYGLKMDNDHFFYIYKRMSSDFSDKVLMKIRTAHKACRLIEKNNIARTLLKNRDEGGIYYFIADQYPDKGSGIDLQFLNQKTKVFNGPEILARKLSLPVVYFDVERVRRGHYRSEYVMICEDASKTEEGYITAEYARLLERGINKNRPNWLWSHKRWKIKK